MLIVPLRQRRRVPCVRTGRRFQLLVAWETPSDSDLDARRLSCFNIHETHNLKVLEDIPRTRPAHSGRRWLDLQSALARMRV